MKLNHLPAPYAFMIQHRITKNPGKLIDILISKVISLYIIYIYIYSLLHLICFDCETRVLQQVSAFGTVVKWWKDQGCYAYSWS